MKKIAMSLLGMAALLPAAAAWADVPVFSANGYICGKEGVTVTCKGPIPKGKDTITGTGHDLVYLTVNTIQEGTPVRYTYFSDTGCLIGYTFNAAGQPVAAVASHRKGAKQTFQFQAKEDYEKVVDFCVKDQPATAGAPAATPATAKAAPAATDQSGPPPMKSAAGN